MRDAAGVRIVDLGEGAAAQDTPPPADPPAEKDQYDTVIEAVGSAVRMTVDSAGEAAEEDAAGEGAAGLMAPAAVEPAEVAHWGLEVSGDDVAGWGAELAELETSRAARESSREPDDDGGGGGQSSAERLKQEHYARLLKLPRLVDEVLTYGACGLRLDLD